MPMALALATTSSAPLTLTVATASALNSPLPSTLLIAPTSTVSLTPGPSSDPVISNDSPSDNFDSALGTSPSASSAVNAGGSGSSSPGAGPSKGPSRSAQAASSSQPAQAQAQAAAPSAVQSKKPEDLIPTTQLDKGKCYGATVNGNVTRQCCTGLQGSIASDSTYCLFDEKNRAYFDTCVGTALEHVQEKYTIKCNGSRRNRATWAVIALGVAVALGVGSA